ncbi:uncharacterized protein LOC131933256 [Physella acuta]|uniref:uncharacterized protein LOC131933256 n=1 Tax=Physella acuta TaxID=109671 RepID=UPI0027DAE398|nr:uncharacterized protein LOC131933256 [Physella acuta]
MVMMYFNNNARTVEYFTYNLVLERYVSVFIISNALSLILSLLIETPVRNLIKPSKKPTNSTATLPDTQHKNQISRPKSTTHETSFMPVKSFGPDVTDGTAVVLTEIRELQQQTSHPATGRRLSSRHEGYSNDGFLSENPYVDISPIKGLHNLRSINK